MKKNILLLGLLLLTLLIRGQDLVPNKSFEIWVTGTYDYPQNYLYTSNPEAFYWLGLNFNELKSTDAYHGTYAVELKTVSSKRGTAAGYFVNSPYTDDDLNTWHGGIPYTGMPTGIRGYYKYNVETDDAGFIVVSFSKSGVNIGSYLFLLEGDHTDYQLFEFTLSPALTQVPDSMVFGAASSDLFNDRVLTGSTLLIDSVKLTGVTEQPVLMNNDFESWGSKAENRAEAWNFEMEGTAISTDAYDGSYALELNTFAGNEEGSIVARGAMATNGYYSEACDCLTGGYPYDLTEDALVFYYKYEPAAGTDDNAEAFVMFRKNGTSIWQESTTLPAATDYTRVEIPFDIPNTPDTAVIFFQSSGWSNKDLSYVGSSLTVDNVFFKSEETPTALKRLTADGGINVYPNPSSDRITVDLGSDDMVNESSRIEIYNVIGKPVLKSFSDGQKTDLDISQLPKGIYFVKIYEGNSVHTSKILKR